MRNGRKKRQPTVTSQPSMLALEKKEEKQVPQQKREKKRRVEKWKKKNMATLGEIKA